MVTKVELINNALAQIGERVISSEADTSDEANTALRLFSVAERDARRMRHWFWLQAREPLAAAVREGWFRLPNDLGKLEAVHENNVPVAEWFLHGEEIQVPNATVPIVYYQRKDVPIEKWPDIFVSLCEAILVMKLGAAYHIDGVQARERNVNAAYLDAEVADRFNRKTPNLYKRAGYAGVWQGGRR